MMETKEYKKAIYKAREIDLKATMAQLDINEETYLAYSSIPSVEAVRMAASRQQGGTFSVKRCLNGVVIRRTE